ncbi:predicted protein [Postia placenta Mad-698-R]|nr:predicted protein [Postia placenta Mad-698-R]
MSRKKQLFEFAQNPANAPKSKTRMSRSRPDGFFIRNSGPKGRFRWMDIALSAEYKKVENAKTKDDLWQDVRKVIWSMHHCMREDARRRFTYGLTIENRTMRMWFCSRIELLVSKPLDFMSEHHKVVHFFVAMIYAAEHEAGWDPTMQYVRKKNGTDDELELDKEGKPRLDIDVRDQNGTVVRYRTIRWLSDDGANDLRSRGTRVWEVCILDKNKEGVDRFALKDQWIDADRQREGMIIEQLRNANADKQTKDAIHQSLLTVEHHGDVYVEGMLDHTRSLMARDGVPPMHSGSKLQQIPEDETDLKKQMVYLHAAIRGIAIKLNEIREQLVSCYLKAEQDLGAIDHTVGHDLLYNVFITLFGKIISKLQEKDIQIDILRNDPRQRIEDPFEIPSADGQNSVTDGNGPADDDTEEDSDGGDQGSGLAALTREVSVGDMTEEATAKDGANDVVVEDPDAGRSVDKATESSVPQISTEPLVEGRSTRPQRKRAPPVRYGTESNVQKGTTRKTASSSSTLATATQAAAGQSTSRTTSNTKATPRSSTKAKTKTKRNTK